MAVRKFRNSWWVDFMFNHARYRKRSPENTRAGAVAFEIVLRQRLARGESLDYAAVDAHNNETFKTFSETWFEDYVRPNNKYSEQRTKKYVLSAALVPFFGGMPIGSIGSHDIERFKAQQIANGITNKTLKNRLSVLNKCLVTAYDWLRLEGMPPRIKWPKCAPPRVDYLSTGECEVLLAHAEGMVLEMILAALRTGMRQGELKGLQWSSIDWENQSVVVRHSRDDYRKQLVPPKSNRERHIPLDVDLYETFYRRKKASGYVFLDVDGQPFDNKRLSRRIKNVCKDAGLRPIGWHTLRHTFASHLAMRGVPLPAVKDLLGHSSITTTMRYAHLAPSTLRAAIEMLNPRTMSRAELRQPSVNPWHEMQQREAA